MLTIDLAIWIMYFITIYFASYMLLTFFEHDIEDKPVNNIKSLPSVTVVIPAYNEEKNIIKTLESVLNLDYPSNKLSLIVVDDKSTDKTRQVLDEFLRHYRGNVSVKAIHHTVNKGKGTALNTALQFTQSTYFVCLDADSYVERGALHKMLPYIEKDENIASVLPFIRIPFSHGLTYRLQYVEYLVNFFLKKILGTIDSIHVTPGPFGLYRTAILRKLGGFDEKNLTEDLEIALRLQKNNYKIIQLLSTDVYTIPPSTFKGWYKQRNRWYKGTLFNIYKYKNLIFNRKYGEFGFFQMPMILLSALLSIFFAIFVLWKHVLLPFMEKLYDISYINFDYVLLNKLWLERFTFFDINFMLVYFLFVIIVFALFWISLAHKYAKVNFFKRGIFNTLIYILIYPTFLSIVWIGIVVDLFLRRVQRW